MKFSLKSDAERRININMIQIAAHVARWKPGTEFEVSVVRKQKTVSDPMRRYFFGVVFPIFCDAYGYDPDDEVILYHHLKALFFRINPDAHGVYKGVPSLFGNNSEIAIANKAKFVEWIKRKSAEQGAYTPDPGEESK